MVQIGFTVDALIHLADVGWLLVQIGLTLDPDGFRWIQMDSDGFRWIQMDSDG